MSNSDLCQENPLEEGKPLQIKTVGCPNACAPDKLALRPDAATIHLAGHHKLFCAIRFLSGRPS